MIHKWWASNYLGTEAEHSLEPFIAALGQPYRTQFPYFQWGVKFFPDFLLPTLGIILEVDDDSHLDPEKQKADAQRTGVLEGIGWRVLRCSNYEATNDPQAVVASILDFLAVNGARDLSRIITSKTKPRSKKKRSSNHGTTTTLRGTGAGGAVTREDVERAAAERRPGAPPAGAPAAPARPRLDVARMRQSIAAAMARSKREIPHYYVAHTIDLQGALAWLADENTRRPVTERLLYGVLLIRAVALALREVPELNAVWRGDRVEPSRAVHVGVAISLRGGGLIAPALHDADRQPLGDLMRALRGLVQRARGGGLRSSELSDATITVTSLGEQGVESVLGIVYPPQVAIVGFGRIVERPWVVGGAVVPRPVVTATLSADHRVSDGHRGGLFLAAVERLLQEPERL